MKKSADTDVPPISCLWVINTKNVSTGPSQIYKDYNCVSIWLGLVDMFLVFKKIRWWIPLQLAPSSITLTIERKIYIVIGTAGRQIFACSLPIRELDQSFTTRHHRIYLKTKKCHLLQLWVPDWAFLNGDN